jgi:hypothetical protein
MRDTAPALVWPPLLELPPDDVKLVYLDLNHWISFAQASTGHPNGTRFVDTLKACKAATSAGAAVFVLSATHYLELNKIKDPSQRQAIANVMEELTGFASLIDRVVVMSLELDAMLDPLAKAPSPWPRIPVLGRGVRHCFGRASGVRIMGPDGDATEEVRAQMGAEKFDELVAQAELGLERSVLRGPADDEVENLRARGYKPETTIESGEKRAAQERQLTTILDADPAARHDRLRDVVATRELCVEFEDILPRVLVPRQLALRDVISDPESGRKFVRAMPGTEVSIELKKAWHSNRDKKWSANDIYDIDAMALAVPYCDIVVTEKACHHALTTAQLGERMHTALLRDLNELPSTLEQWEPKRKFQKASA